VASCWVSPVTLPSGTRRFRVYYRLRWATSPTYCGSFKSRKEANLRKQSVLGQIAVGQVPDLTVLREPEAKKAPALRELADAWKATRVDVSEGTMTTYEVVFGRLLPRLGDVAGADLEPRHVAGLVAELTEAGLKKQTVRKTVSVLAMVLDHHGIQPNPARDPRVKLPREEKAELNPPSAGDVITVHGLLPSKYRLPLLVLDGTGMRVGELESLTWGDVDERRGRWRIRTAASKTRAARWVSPPVDLFAAVVELCPRDDRVPDRPVFGGFGAERFRRAIARACTGAGIASFSPHDLRHRRISLLHAQGLSWARIGEAVGHSDLMTTARTYTHVLADEAELDYEALLSG
jgi:integrase